MVNVLLIISMLALSSASPDTFRFSQVECQSFEFFSVQKNNFENPMIKVGETEPFACPGSGAFPEESGLVFGLVLASTGRDEGRLTTTVNTDLFQDNVAQVKKGWIAAFRMSFTPAFSAGFNVLKIFDNDNNLMEEVDATILNVLEPTLCVNSKRSAEVCVEVVPDRENIVDIVFGEGSNASITSGAKEFDFGFVCASVNGGDAKCDDADPMPILTSSSAKMDLFEPKINVASIMAKISTAHFDYAPTDNIVANNRDEFLGKLTDIVKETVDLMPEPVSLPAFDESKSLSMNEDKAVSTNLRNPIKGRTVSSNELSFEVSDNLNNGVIARTGSSKVMYNPKKALVVKNLDFDVFSSIPSEISAEVATDSESVDGKLNGTLTFGNRITGVISATCNSSLPISELPVVDGSVFFCYTPDDTLTSGNFENLRFTVKDETNRPATGIMVFHRRIPKLLPDEPPFEITNESVPVSFSLGQNRFGLRPPGLPEDIDIGIRVLRATEFFLGKMTDSDGNKVDFIFNSDFLPSDVLTFKPARGLFNLVNGSPLDAAGNEVPSCKRRIEFNGEKVCAFSFEYKVFVGEVESDLAEAFFIVNAVDDGNAKISIDGEQRVDLTSLEVSNVAITSDGGKKAFPVKLQISSGIVIDFMIKPPSNLEGFSASAGFNRGISVQDCGREPCTSLDLIGVPSQLEEVANDLLLIRRPVSGLLAMRLEVVSSAEEFGNGNAININFIKQAEELVLLTPVGTAGIAVGFLCLIVVGFYIGIKGFPRPPSVIQSL